MEIQNIYKEYYPKILGYLTRIVGNRVEAEDLTQDVFIKVSEALDRFEGRSSLSTWIYKIATNTANDCFRSDSFQQGKKLTLPAELIKDCIEDKNVWTGEKESTSDKMLEKEEMNCCIKRYVQDINENYRTAFILSEYEGLRNTEIADILGLSIETVKIRISRARKQLREKMEKGCEIARGEKGLTCNEL
jgi:RNA polymerase sigma-70 factor, ECF subfamily